MLAVKGQTFRQEPVKQKGFNPFESPVLHKLNRIKEMSEKCKKLDYGLPRYHDVVFPRRCAKFRKNLDFAVALKLGPLFFCHFKPALVSSNIVQTFKHNCVIRQHLHVFRNQITKS